MSGSAKQGVTKFSHSLPTLKVWSKNFRQRSQLPPRITIANSDLAQKGFNALKLKNVKNMTAVEMNPGLGVWTTALKDNGFKRTLSLEPFAPYFNWMQGLSEESNNKVEVLKLDGYDWETYNILKEPQYLGSLENKDWANVHPNILFTGTIPKTSKGEQLLAQLMTCLVNKMAIHTLGRIQMAFWIPDALYHKLVGPAATYNRCKMSVISEASADINLVCTAESNEMYPNHLYHLVHILPFAENLITAQWDVFEYVLKHLFVMQKKSLVHMIK
ncbi:MAG: ribosomal RNA adenine methyltransferase KsgA/Erm [Benjaminiella poitrasii]|nr:MAG: ribosomal RNA adenine methyltransferase KsgA/Erm [Benjaminiella poitrasii]